CSECETENRVLRRKTEQPADSRDSVPDNFIRNLGPGESLDAATRAFFEPRLGRDLGGVRLHTDSEAQTLSRSVGARAFTVAKHIVFGAGQYAPGTTESKRLIAHELTHVVQQDGGIDKQALASGPKASQLMRQPLPGAREAENPPISLPEPPTAET